MLREDTGGGSVFCKMPKRKTNEEFIRDAVKIHGDKYEYNKVEYQNSKVKVLVTCKEHGDFWVRPNDLLSGHGCPVCRYINAHNKTRKTTEQFIADAKSVHGDKYDYSKTKYIQAHERVTITCPKHGDFSQEPNVHLKGFGCPKCSQSHLEKTISKLLEENAFFYDYEKEFEWLRNRHPLSIDFFIPEINVGIECQGKQHFFPIDWFGGENSYVECVERDIIKNKKCSENGILILYYANKEDFLENDLYNDDNIFFDKNELLKVLIEKRHT